MSAASSYCRPRLAVHMLSLYMRVSISLFLSSSFAQHPLHYPLLYSGVVVVLDSYKCRVRTFRPG